MTSAACFWSYVHSDDAADDGAIRTLAGRLRDQYNLVTGEPLELFIDRDMRWGDEWSRRIEDAIAGTTFFIPIVTPGYFKSRACRDELIRFKSRASRLGTDQLVMPIYWVMVRKLEANGLESSDQIVKTIA